MALGTRLGASQGEGAVRSSDRQKPFFCGCGGGGAWQKKGLSREGHMCLWDKGAMLKGRDLPTAQGPAGLQDNPHPQSQGPQPASTLPMEGLAHPRVAQESQVHDGSRGQQHEQERCRRQQQLQQEPRQGLARQQQGPQAVDSQAYPSWGHQG